MAENDTTQKPRRSGSETRRAVHRLTFRMTPEEHAALTEAAARDGLTLGSYLRKQALPERRTPARRVPRPDRAALAAVAAQLQRGGNNLNQIARHMNFGDTVLADEIRAALAEWRKATATALNLLDGGTR